MYQSNLCDWKQNFKYNDCLSNSIHFYNCKVKVSFEVKAYTQLKGFSLQVCTFIIRAYLLILNKNLKK